MLLPSETFWGGPSKAWLDGISTAHPLPLCPRARLEHPLASSPPFVRATSAGHGLRWATPGFALDSVYLVCWGLGSGRPACPVGRNKVDGFSRSRARLASSRSPAPVRLAYPGSPARLPHPASAFIGSLRLVSAPRPAHHGSPLLTPARPVPPRLASAHLGSPRLAHSSASGSPGPAELLHP